MSHPLSRRFEAVITEMLSTSDKPSAKVLFGDMAEPTFYIEEDAKVAKSKKHIFLKNPEHVMVKVKNLPSKCVPCEVRHTRPSNPPSKPPSKPHSHPPSNRPSFLHCSQEAAPDSEDDSEDESEDGSEDDSEDDSDEDSSD